MTRIHLLDEATVDKIAAGEVVERPASVVKELVENSIDAGASVVRVEISDGGIAMIRVTDNGGGIDPESVPMAFLRHATSKIDCVDDLLSLHSLGFRGEALASIAAVAKVELVTKTADSAYAVRYCIEGGEEKRNEKTGAPEGTSITIRQLFYNVPVRRKFLKTPVSEALRVHEIMTDLALSHPAISFTFVTNGQVKLTTSGKGSTLEAVSRIYGHEFGREMLEVNASAGGMNLSGYIGSPALSRGNRGFETFFVNGRHVDLKTGSKAIEEAYRGYTMQHRFPVCVLYLQIPPGMVDMNIHPAKSRVRLVDREGVFNLICTACLGVLQNRGRVPQVRLSEPVTYQKKAEEIQKSSALREQPAPAGERQPAGDARDKRLQFFMDQMRDRVMNYHGIDQPAKTGERERSAQEQSTEKTDEQVQAEEQISLFQNETQVDRTDRRYQLIGQLFDTYWLVESDETLYIVDQHAAHEKVLYEQTMQRLRNKEFTSQMVSPPIVLNVTPREESVLKERMEELERIGFCIEPFGDKTYAVTGVPDNLYNVAQERLLREILDEEAGFSGRVSQPDVVLERIASLSCKAAIKGNTRMDAEQMNELLRRLFALDNPYHCPHGRPTMIAMSHRELDKKFKRIV